MLGAVKVNCSELFSVPKSEVFRSVLAFVLAFRFLFPGCSADVTFQSEDSEPPRAPRCTRLSQVVQDAIFLAHNLTNHKKGWSRPWFVVLLAAYIHIPSHPPCIDCPFLSFLRRVEAEKENGAGVQGNSLKRMVSTMVCGPFGGIYPYPFSDEGEYIASSAHSLDSINTIAPSSSHRPDLTPVTQPTQQ